MLPRLFEAGELVPKLVQVEAVRVSDIKIVSRHVLPRGADEGSLIPQSLRAMTLGSDTRSFANPLDARLYQRIVRTPSRPKMRRFASGIPSIFDHPVSRADLGDYRLCFDFELVAAGRWIARLNGAKAWFAFVDELLEGDLHGKRVLSLAHATLGVMVSASLAVAVIGRSLAQARGLLTRHAIKQVDRLLSNQAIDPWDIAARWVPEVIGVVHRHHGRDGLDGLR